MTKNYSEQLGEWVKQRASTKRDKNLVAFLAIREDVKAAVEAGYSVKTIWANMHETKRFESSYDTFLNYVKQMIRKPQADQPATSPKQKGTAMTDGACTKPTINSKPATHATIINGLPGFVFNPVPNIEELI